MKRVVTSIKLHGSSSGDPFNYLLTSLTSFKYIGLFGSGDFYLRYDYTLNGEPNLTLFIYNEEMLNDEKVRELLLEYMI